MRHALTHSSSPRRRGSSTSGPRLKAGVTVIFVLLASCATLPGKKTSTQRTVSSTTKIGIPSPPPTIPKEIMRPEAVKYAEVQSPKRSASMKLVGEGKSYLDLKDYDQARRRLEDAITIDPTNGSAYYHLAVVYYNLREYPKALGFLDQAESLFHASPEWMETIQKFREMMQ